MLPTFLRPGRTAVTLVMAVCVCAGGAACSPKEAVSTDQASVRIGASLPLVTQGSGVPALVSGFTKEQLVSIGGEGRPVGRLAERWEPLPEGNGLRVHLRPDIKFHDGSPLTVERAADILRWLIRQRNPAALTYKSITSIEAKDGALDIRTARHEAFLINDLADATIAPPDAPDIGTGPFAITHKDAQITRLTGFKDYYRGQPTIDRLEVRSYQSQRSAWSALMRGEIDAVHEVSREAIDFVESESTVRTYSFVRAYYILLGFNVARGAFKNPELRRALNQAVNREAVITLAMSGRGEVANGPVWPLHWAHSTASRAYTYNPEAAKLRLDASGFTLPAEAPKGRMPSRLAFKCLIWADEPRFERIALVVQKQLYDIGVDMELEPVSGGVLGMRLQKGDFDAFLFEATSGRSLSWVYQFWHSPTADWQPFLGSGYTAADAVLDRLRSAESDDVTRGAVADLQRVFYDDPPAVFIAWGKTARALRNDFVVPADTPPDVLGSVWHWRRVAANAVARR